MVANLGRVFLLVALVFTLSACLVTDEIQFPEDVPYPPTIIDVPGAEIQIGSIVWVDLAEHPQNEWRLPVRIRDDNVDQTLEARYRVVWQEDLSPMWAKDEIVPSGSPTREDYDVKVRFGDLQPGACHHVELVVSGSFLRRTENSFFDVLNDEGQSNDDIARASWTILEGKGEIAPSADEKVRAAMNERIARLLESCETSEKFLEDVVPGGTM